MRPTPIAVAIIGLVLITPTLWADAGLEREFSELQQQHEKALQAAAEPVNRRHQAALESLLRRATQAGDLQTANKINEQLKKLGVTLAETPTAESLTAYLVGTKWTWFGNETITFLADGKARWKDSPDLWPWKISNTGRRVVSGENVPKGRKFTITFDREMKTGLIEGDTAPRKTQIIAQ